MGLDQYLHAKRYYSSAEWRGEEVNNTFTKIMEVVNADLFVSEDLPSAEVSVKVCSWRKANAIHGWFVSNVQDGEDDCREYLVERTQLVQLRDLCKKVLDNRDMADELLPSTSGFFFGSTEYDDYYFGDLMTTIDLLDKALVRVPNAWDFYYQSSW